MKPYALALCVAGVLGCAVVARADQPMDQPSSDQQVQQRSHDRRMDRSERRARHEQERAERRAERRDRRADRWNSPEWSNYSAEESYYVHVMWPDLPSREYIARRATQIAMAQDHEIDELMALAPRERTAGYTNTFAVFESMAADHARLAHFCNDWLDYRGFPVPPPPSMEVVVTTADDHPRQSVDEQLQEHQRMFGELLDQRANEHSATVRGMLLWAAATTARHITLLEILDRDIDMGRHQLSARLELELNPTLVASSEYMARIEREDHEYFASREQALVYVVPVQPAPTVTVQVPPPPAPAPPVVAEAPPPAPVTPPAVVQRTIVRSRVAGHRQVRRRPYRRPAY